MTDKKLPLKGKHVVLTRSTSAGDDWEKYLKRRGAIIHSFPMITTATIRPTSKLRRDLIRSGDFGWIVFTSATGARSFKELTKKFHLSLSASHMPPIAAIGEATAAVVRAIGYPVAFTASQSDSVTLARELAPLRSPIGLLRADIASKELPMALRMRGVRVVDIPIYKTTIIRKPNARFLKLIASGKIDYLVFASSSSVKGFIAQTKGDGMRATRHITAIALGERIGKALKRTGFRNVCIASESNLRGVARLFRG